MNDRQDKLAVLRHDVRQMAERHGLTCDVLSFGVNIYRGGDLVGFFDSKRHVVILQPDNAEKHCHDWSEALRVVAEAESNE